MKVNKKIINKLLISFILSIVIFITTKNVYGYEITHKVLTKEQLYTDITAPGDFPEMIYKNQVKAYESTKKAYNDGTYNIAADGWVYMSNPGGNVVTGNEEWNYEHSESYKTSFVTIYQMFHKYQNSVYSYESSDKTSSKKYYDTTATGEYLWPNVSPVVVRMNAKVFYDVTSETSSYTGLYWQPANDSLASGSGIIPEHGKNFADYPFHIAKSVIDASKGYYTAGPNNNVVLYEADKSTYRFAVKGDTYISDQIITKDFVDVLWEKFRDNSSSKELKIYGSSVNRTAKSNSKNGEQYWAHMDTAYKFFKTTLYGNYSGSWGNSKSILGGNGWNKEEAENSVVNLYDNTFIFPKVLTEKKVYVRHIDKTNGKNELIEGLVNTQAIEVLNKKDALGRYQYSSYRGANGRNLIQGIYKYNEYYELDVTDNNYIIGNIKYSNDESYTVPVKSLNYTDFNRLEANEKKILEDYNCIGAVVGYGDSYEAAVAARDQNLNNSVIRNGYDWTSVEINGNSANEYVIIDFYYEEKEKDISKTIYVRHIDDTDGKNELITGLVNTHAIEVLTEKADNKYQFVDYRGTSDRNLQLGIYNYNEVYQMNTPNNWIIGNIKYSNNESYTVPVKSLNYDDFNLLEANEKKILNDYDCAGVVVGYGNTYEEAINARDINLNNGVIQNFVNYTYEEVVGTGSSKVIIIDFYYKEKIKEDISKTIYVRHIDDTDGKNELILGLKNTRAIEVLNAKNNDNKYQFVSYRGASSRNLQLGIYKYNEVYQMNTVNNWIIGNIKYSNNESYTVPVKSLNYTNKNALEAIERSILDDYDCAGAVVGYGDTYETAVNSRDINRSNNVKIYGGDWTYQEVIGTGSSKVIIIDFYYTRKIVNPPRHIYVRHIDVTDLTVNTVNVNSAITKGNILKGTGQAQIISSGTMVSNQAASINQYQEYFVIDPGEELKVIKSNNDDYNCIGSNIVGYSENSFTQLKNNMNTNRLNNGLYSTSNLNKQYRLTTDISSSPTAILIDFYYKAKHDDTVIARNPIGRLSFYTLADNPTLISGDSSGKKDSASGNINTTVTDNSKKVYDVIPSGESLKMSVDNAYVYMLGAINIQEQEIKNTYTFDYTIKYPFIVNYTDYYGNCSTHGKRVDSVPNKDVFSGKCGKYLYTTRCSEDDEDCTPTDVYCENELTVATKSTKTSGIAEVIYTYTIPYEYTYYKVKNMRMYTIDKIELWDDYNNSGLPLFDGQKHTVYPTTSYNESFSNATFDESTDSSSAELTKEVAEDYALIFNYSNPVGDVDVSIPYDSGLTSVKNIFKEKIDHSEAAKMEFMDKAGTIAPAALESKQYLKAELYLKNDEVYFTDKVANKPIYIVGDDVNKSTTRENSNYEYTNYKSEKYAKKVIDLSKYTSGKTRKDAGETSKYTYDVKETDRVSVSTVYPNTIVNKYLPSANLTTEAYFNDDTFEIPKDRLNGKRYSYGKIYYNLLSNNNVLNFDASYDDSKNGNHNWNNSTGRTAVAKSGITTFIDTEMKKVNSSNISDNTTTIIKPTSLNEIIWEYGKKDKESMDVDIVDVFTPVSLKTWVDKNSENSDKLVNHTGEATSTFQIQKNARFAIKMEPTDQNGEYTSLNTNKYLMQYYIKFDFDVQNIKIIDAKSNGVQRNYDSYYVSADTWIGPIYNQYGDNILNGAAEISAVALSDQNEATSVVNQEQNEYTVRAVAYNSTSSLLTALVNNRLTTSTFVTNKFNQFSGVDSDNNDHNEYYGQQNITGHSGYIAEDFKETVNLSRVYDFKVTDVKDLDWKDIFRKSTTATTNVHTSKAYYAGIKKWNIYTTNVNELLTRDASEIGATKQQILPIGPYKNTNSTYTKAPKLGYKFSFDLKTTGATADKDVIIEPEFYYISKEENGNTGKPTIKKEIDLYYKNSSNKYVPIKNYNLYFVPDDGYRLTFVGTDESYRFSSTHLSKSTVSLGNAKRLTLTRNMMEEADNMFVQIWYGEYKLPNSTIAVPRNGDINRDRLTEGYIGVKFNITVKEDDGTEIYYNSQDKTSSKTNTTQWDYEGYLGYNKDGDEVTSSDNIRLPLEGMSWKLTQEDYEFIRGTVILYDTDARASSDYN